jgi:Skp family chaperone for outer membrane proteins
MMPPYLTPETILLGILGALIAIEAALFYIAAAGAAIAVATLLRILQESQANRQVQKDMEREAAQRACEREEARRR